jgi:hypothetical protein
LPPQPIVAPKLDNQDIGAQPKYPVQTREASGRGVPADSGVDNLNLRACIMKESPRDGRECFTFSQAATGAQAIAEKDDPRCIRVRGG